MRLVALIVAVLVTLVSNSAFAASYQQIDGTIVEPIQFVFGGDHPYSGINLQPFANLTVANVIGASLNGAILTDADLTGANLTNANLFLARLYGANLTDADLTGANLTNANLLLASLSGAILSGVSLTNAIGLGNSFGAAFYDINTDFTDTGFDPVAAGWTLVPEPGTALLMGLGLAGLASRRR